MCAMPHHEQKDPLLRHLAYKHPILLPLLIAGIALVLRINDIFILKLDERWGEIILSKSLGFLLVVAYIYATGRTLAAIGLHDRHRKRALLLGTAIMSVIFLAGFGIQYVTLSAQNPQFLFVGIDPKTGMAGGALFALWLVLGNVINSFMEEGLFRGLMIPHFRRAMGFWQANTLQAALFSVWHVVWPIKSYLTGDASLAAAGGEAGMLIFATFVSGFVFGYLYMKTDSLWAPWVAHTVNNTVLNLVHIQTLDTLDPNMIVVHVTLVNGLLLAIPVIRSLSRKWSLPEVSPLS